MLIGHGAETMDGHRAEVVGPLVEGCPGRQPSWPATSMMSRTNSYFHTLAMSQRWKGSGDPQGLTFQVLLNGVWVELLHLLALPLGTPLLDGVYDCSLKITGSVIEEQADGLSLVIIYYFPRRVVEHF